MVATIATLDSKKNTLKSNKKTSELDSIRLTLDYSRCLTTVAKLLHDY
jgi:hypothetical protein